MKKHILIGAGLLLTLGTAVAGTFIYGQGTPESTVLSYQPVVDSVAQEATPQMIAMWKATARFDDYIAPKVPI